MHDGSETAPWKELTIEEVAKWNWLLDAAVAAQANQDLVQAADVLIATLEQQLRQRVNLPPDDAVLRRVPGIGDIQSKVITLETGPFKRFTSAGNYSSPRCASSASLGRQECANGGRTVELVYVFRT